jgi:Na+/H+ antiporter NhaD/arsenite permease-like protein
MISINRENRASRAAVKTLARLFTAGSGALASPALLAAGAAPESMDFTGHWTGLLAALVFLAAYSLVIAEEAIHLRKSKPVVVAAGVIWVLVAIAYARAGDLHTAEQAVRHNLLEFAELFLFLLAAMTYINTMEDRGVFNALRAWLVSQGFSLRQIFWLTGGIAFAMSPLADNLTTALLMATVVMAIGGDNPRFVSLACINIVVAANAGGAFSPFGDITTLMVWQKGVVEFQEFFALFLPAAVNWLIPAAIMAFAVPHAQPAPLAESARLLDGAVVVAVLFIATICMAVGAHHFLHLPPVLGMMTGLGLLKLYGYRLQMRAYHRSRALDASVAGSLDLEHGAKRDRDRERPFDIFELLARAEWDTLMFFYGVILCVGGLATIGYLALLSEFSYGGLGPTATNILVGILSAVVDNIPLMFAVLSMMPAMDHGQWLLVTLTAGVGGSLLSVGSAAGVAVMGAARGVYTFFSHLKWTWAVALGYAASIAVHFLVNARYFT